MDQMARLTICDNRFEADLLRQALDEAGVPHRFKGFEDTAYDGLFVTQKGFAAVYVAEDRLAEAQEIAHAIKAGAEAAKLTPEQLAAMIDHTLLDPAAGEEKLSAHLEQCLEMGMAAACILPWMVTPAADRLAGSRVKVCSVVDFPLGASAKADKLAMARLLAGAGAQELDVVINRGLIASGRLEQAVEDVALLAEELDPVGVKVILETGQIGPAASRRAAAMLAGSKAAFLKTGTGFFGPATSEDVALLRESAGDEMGVKAAGGITSLDIALEMISAGADRLGTSSGAAIVRQAREEAGEETEEE